MLPVQGRYPFRCHTAVMSATVHSGHEGKRLHSRVTFADGSKWRNPRLLALVRYVLQRL